MTKNSFFPKASSFKQYFESLLSIQTRRGKIGHSLSVCALGFFAKPFHVSEFGRCLKNIEEVSRAHTDRECPIFPLRVRIDSKLAKSFLKDKLFAKKRFLVGRLKNIAFIEALGATSGGVFARPSTCEGKYPRVDMG